MITNFKDKRVAEYLRELPPGGRALIRFGHGWGDTQMFMPAFESLKSQFPTLQIDIYLECGQEDIFDSVKDKEGTGYDVVFSLDFPMSEGSELTKGEKCCVEELGIEPVNGFAKLKPHDSPLVACHFQGTALPNSVNCPEGVAQKIWHEIIEAGKIPFEVHFEHVFHNPVNRKYGFVTNTARGSRANLKNLIGLIQHCFAFVGVASGPWVTAASVLPERTLYLERAHPLKSYTRKDMASVKVMEYRDGTVKEWLASLQ